MTGRERKRGVGTCLAASAGMLIAALGTKLYQGPGRGLVAGYAGDIFFVGFPFFLFAALCPRWSAGRIAAITFGAAAAAELFQATGIPARFSGAYSFWLGASFDWCDLAAYGVGLAFCRILERRISGRSS